MEDIKAVESTEPKRPRRDRKRVSLLSNEYLTIYDDANNRKLEANPKKKKTSKKEEDEDVQISSTTTFKWIGEGKKVPNDGANLYYDNLEIKVGDHPALIQVGDDILLSSDDTEEADVFDKTTVNRNNIDVDLVAGKADSNVAMNQLRPFVGKVEAMWEVGAGRASTGGAKKGDDVVNKDDDRRNKMKLRVRWYYKVRRCAILLDRIIRTTVRHLFCQISPSLSDCVSQPSFRKRMWPD